MADRAYDEMREAFETSREKTVAMNYRTVIAQVQDNVLYNFWSGDKFAGVYYGQRIKEKLSKCLITGELYFTVRVDRV